MASAVTTTDHETIRRWVETRGGCPSHVKGTGAGDDPGILRIDFPGYSGVKTLEAISWEQFFSAFEENELAFLYDEEVSSRFNKLISRRRVTPGASPSSRRPVESSKSSPNAAEESGEPAREAVELLTAQHREIEALFEKFRDAKSGSQKKRVAEKIADRLAAHSKVEETLFYPTAFVDTTEHLLREAVEEHLVMKRILADILDMDGDDPQLSSKLAVLEEIVRHHVEEEEGELFPIALEKCSDDLEALGEKMKKRYAKLMSAEPRIGAAQETGAATICF